MSMSISEMQLGEQKEIEKTETETVIYCGSTVDCLVKKMRWRIEEEVESGSC